MNLKNNLPLGANVAWIKRINNRLIIFRTLTLNLFRSISFPPLLFFRQLRLSLTLSLLSSKINYFPHQQNRKENYIQLHVYILIIIIIIILITIIIITLSIRLKGSRNWIRAIDWQNRGRNRVKRRQRIAGPPRGRFVRRLRVEIITFLRK